MGFVINRREFLGLSITGSVALAASRPILSKQVTMQTHTYKTVGKLPIKLDLYLPQQTGPCPVVVWIHGGALINGHRGGINDRVKQDFLKSGYALASIDYRLAPETPLPEIIKDVEDAFVWLRLHADDLSMDPGRIAVLGGSAGGYLTLITGYRVVPRPQCLVSFYGYGDLIGNWYSAPSPHTRHNRVKFTEAHARKQVSGSPISDSRLRDGRGGDFYNWCRQTGRWPLEVSGWDPHSQAELFYEYMPVRNVTAEYPPTLMIHGTADTDVPYEQSELMQQQFIKQAVDHQLIRIENGEHGLGGGKPEAIEMAYREVFAFVDARLKG